MQKPYPEPKINPELVNSLNRIIQEIDRMYKRPLAGAEVSDWVQYADGLRSGLLFTKVGIDMGDCNDVVAMASMVAMVLYGDEIKQALGIN